MLISDWSSDVCSSDLNRAAFGRQDLVDAYLEELDDESDEAHGLSLEDFNLESESIGKHDKEKGDRGPASHIVTVKFGDGESAFDMAFASKAEVGTIQLAYAVTCHKMQGGEAPLDRKSTRLNSGHESATRIPPFS